MTGQEEEANPSAYVPVPLTSYNEHKKRIFAPFHFELERVQSALVLFYNFKF